MLKIGNGKIKSAVRKFAVLSDSIGECRNGSGCRSIFTFDISEQTLRKSLQEVELVGRFQAIKQINVKKLADYLGVPVETLPTIIVDVGHNPHAAKYLSEKLTALKRSIEGKMIAVCGMLKDKDANGVFEHLTPIIDEWHCVTFRRLSRAVRR